MIEVLQKRKTTFRNQCLKYFRYVFNDHFVLFLLIFLGFLAVQYSQFLRSLPKDKSLLLLVLALAPLLLLPIGSIATYFEKPDMIFLLAKEEELKGYLNQQILRATIFWGIVQTLVLVLFVPLALALGLSLTIVVVYLAILFLLKVLVFQGKGKRFYNQAGLDWKRIVEL
ncbi:MAG: ABC transporter permease, partial [Streptococcus xiaochunlingii]